MPKIRRWSDVSTLVFVAAFPVVSTSACSRTTCWETLTCVFPDDPEAGAGGAAAGGAADSGTAGASDSGGAGGASDAAGGTTSSSSGGTPVLSSGGMSSSPEAGNGGTDSVPEGNAGAGGAPPIEPPPAEGGAAGEGGAPNTDPTISIGQPCASAGALACQGTAQKLTLVCDGKTWAANQTCKANENCNSKTGLCAAIATECTSRTPHALFCQNDTLVRCDADLIAPEKTNCTGRCSSDGTPHCEAPFCGDGKQQADEQCDDTNKKSGDGCSATCRDEIKDIVMGYYFTCALSEHGKVKCWGQGKDGATGAGRSEDLPAEGSTPAQLVNVDLGTVPAKRLAAGGYHICAVLQDGSVKCWGKNSAGQLGIGDKVSRGSLPNQMGGNLPNVDLGSSRTALDLACGGHHCCAILDNRSLKCWGANTYGQLGLGNTSNRGDDGGEMGNALLAVDLGENRTARSIYAGLNSSCVTTNSGETYCWGNDEHYQLGIRDSDGSPVGDEPGEMGNALRILDIGSAAELQQLAIDGGGGDNALPAFSCGLLKTGKIKCWGGWEAFSGTTQMRAFSAKEFYASSMLKATATALGQSKACNILENGHVYCVGIGQGSVPDPNLGSSRPMQISNGAYETCAILEDRSLKCWSSTEFAPGTEEDEVTSVDIAF